MKIGVVETNLNARNRMRALLENWIARVDCGLGLAPQFSITTLSQEEVRFHAELELLVVGPDLLTQDLSVIDSFAQHQYSRPIICLVDSCSNSIATVEQLGKLGVEDVIDVESDGTGFVRRVVLCLSRGRKRSKRGQFILVLGGKGGSGITSITAGLGEALMTAGQSVCLVDNDRVSQDLTRFLQVRPYLNETLETLISHNQFLSKESIQECLTPVWNDEQGLCCLAPSTSSESTGVEHDTFRVWNDIQAVLTESHDFVLMDGSGCSLGLLFELQQVADKVIVVVTNDPAAIISNSAVLSKLYSRHDLRDRVLVVEHRLNSTGLDSKFLRTELQKFTGSHDFNWWTSFLPYDTAVRSWPASGKTPFSASRTLSQRLLRLAGELRGEQDIVEELSFPFAQRVADLSMKSRASCLSILKVVINFFSQLKLTRASEEKVHELNHSQKLLVSRPVFID